MVSGQMPQFASDYLLVSRDGHIMAQKFDTCTLKVSGDAQALGNARYFSVSTSDVLAYHESSAESELKVLDRSGNVIATPGPLAVYDWPRFSPVGNSIAVTLTDPKSGTDDIWVYPMMGGPPARVTFGPSDGSPTWSPDGKELAYEVAKDGWSIRKRPLDWITFFSYETGRPEVYVVPFPGAGSKSQVSTTGGWLPRFGGKELFYVTISNRLMAAQVHMQPTFGIESIRPLFQLDFPNPPDRTSPLYDVSPDGRFFAVLTGDRSKTTTITLLTNWPVELRK